MAWARIDDAILDHPKVLEAGEDARDLLVASIIWCNRHLTDGRVPKAALSVLSRKPRAAKTAEALVAVGLWEDHGNAWVLHDFLDWNPSRAEVEEQRNRSAERMRKSRESRQRNERATEPDVAPMLQRNERATSGAVAAPTPLHSIEEEDPPCSPPAAQGDPPLHVAEIREARKRGKAKAKAEKAPRVPSPDAQRVLVRMAELSGCGYGFSKALEERLAQGVPVEDCLAVVEFLGRDPWWRDHRFRGEQAPFREEKFPGYLAQARAIPPQPASITTAHPEARAANDTEIRRCDRCFAYTPHRWTDDGWITDHECASRAAL